MRRLAGLGISAKILLAVAIVAAVGLVGTAYGGWSTYAISRAYDDLVERRGLALTTLASVNRNMLGLGYNAYKMAQLDADSPEGKAARAAYDSYRTPNGRQMAEVATLLPEHAPFVTGAQRQINEITAALDDAVEAGRRGREIEARRRLGDADPGMVRLEAELLAFVDRETAATQAEAQALTRDAARSIWLTLGFTAAAIIAGLLVALRIGSRGVVHPLNGLRGSMQRLADGDTAVEVPGTDRADEVGAMARTVQVFREHANAVAAMEEGKAGERAAREREAAEAASAAAGQARVVAALAAAMGRLAEGDLTCAVQDPFPPAYEGLRADFNAALDSLRQAMATVAGNARGIRGGAGGMASAADDLARRTEQQAASLEETAAALDQITTTVDNTAVGAARAATVVGAARDDAETSGAVVRQTIEAMGKIEGSARQMGQIIGVIDEIAFQTNLLALNAGVEAARAGDAGRGFAVVATEVRALAGRSAEAAKQIKGLISASGAEVGAGATLVRQTGDSLARIVGRIGEISEAISAINASAAEQATGLRQINAAVNQMDQVTQQNAAMVEASTAASHALAQDGEELLRSVGRFRTGDASPAPVPAPVIRAVGEDLPARPARPAVRRELRVVGRGGAAPAPAAANADWKEF